MHLWQLLGDRWPSQELRYSASRLLLPEARVGVLVPKDHHHPLLLPLVLVEGHCHADAASTSSTAVVPPAPSLRPPQPRPARSA